MKPLQPTGSPHRRGRPPSLLSPSSRSAFPAAAEGDHGAAVSEQEQLWVRLYEWWLATVEGDDQKLAVAGTMELKQIFHELCPVPIAKRHSLNVVESEDGTMLLLSGSLNFSRTLGYGYSNTVCKHFMVGFPHWWQSCNLRYPKLTSSDTGCQPCSSHNDSVFPKSSHLPHGAPRFEEHTCDGDIVTNENAAASREAGKGGQRIPVVTFEVPGCHEETQHVALTEKAAVDEEMPTSVYLDVQNSFSLTPILEEYINDGDIPTNEDAAASNVDNERYTAPSEEVNNVEIGLTAGNPSSERVLDDIATDASSAPKMQCTNNEVSEAVYSTPATDRKKTPVACLKNQGSWEENEHVASKKKPVGRPKKQISRQEKCQSATRSPGTRNMNNVEIGLTAGNPSSERVLDDIATDVSLAPTMQCTNNAVSEAVDSTPATDRKKTPVACLNNQGSWGGNEHVASKKKPLGRPKKQISRQEKCQSVTRSPGTRNPVSYVLWSPLTRGKATSLSMSTPEDLKLKRTRSGRVIVPNLDAGRQRIVYGRDGSIAGVIGLASPAVPKRLF